MIEVFPEELSPLLREKRFYLARKLYYHSKRKVFNCIQSLIGEKLNLKREEYLVKKFRDYFKTSSPLFYQIQIETCSFCNETCSFCPANINQDIRGENFISEKIFEKILDDLTKLKFRGLISLFNNNEPLIDKRLEKFISLCKRKVPEAKTEIMTNGKLLSYDRFVSLYNVGIDSISIDNYYKTSPALNNPVNKFVKAFRGSSYEDFIDIPIQLRFQEEILSNRAGNAPNKNNANSVSQRFCPYPFMQFNINYEGKVNLCCNDVYYQEIMGDVMKNSIEEIWKNRLYVKVREKIINKDRDIGICKNCDATNNLSGDLYLNEDQIEIPSYIQGKRRVAAN